MKILKLSLFVAMIALAIFGTLSFDKPRCRCYDLQYEVTGVTWNYPGPVEYTITQIGYNSISCKLPYKTGYPEGPWVGMEKGDKYSVVNVFCPNK